MESGRFACLTIIALVLGVGCGTRHESPPADIGDDSAMAYDPVERGQATYGTYCQSCHGPEGHGDGPIAPMLTLELSDLSRLVEKYGEFPEELVRASIDGRAEVRGHGTREMPVWGNIWNDPIDPVAEERINQQIAELVQFVESIQDTPE